MSALTRLEALHRRFSGPVPQRMLAGIDAGGVASLILRDARADLRFWRDYVRQALRRARVAMNVGARDRATADIRYGWGPYRKSASLVRRAERQIAEPTAAAAE